MTDIVIFELVNDKNNSKFLHIFNSHNGYYSHGFTFECDNQIIKKGSI